MRHAKTIASELGLCGSEQRTSQIAVFLHDVGKISVPDRILHKPSKLTPEEAEATGSAFRAKYSPIGADDGRRRRFQCDDDGSFYRKGKAPEEAQAVLAGSPGSQWNPDCIAAFLRVSGPFRNEAHRHEPAHTVDQPNLRRRFEIIWMENALVDLAQIKQFCPFRSV